MSAIDPATATDAATATADRTDPEPASTHELADAPRTRRPLTVALGIMLLLGAIVAAAAVVPTPRWDLWLVGVLALLGASLGLLVIALMPREIARAGRGRQDGEDFGTVPASAPAPVPADEADPTAAR